MSRYIAWLLNDTGLLKTNGGSVENGTTTLVAALVEDGRSRVLKVGDSLALRTYTSGGQGVAEVLSESFELRYALGQQNAPGDNAVESFEREGGRLVLVSDGVFNYLTDPVADIARWSMLSGDAVFIAEKVVRSVLRNQAQWGYADDVTIVVQDTGR
jgi:serine/threonine protein phosphatase PrpC